MFDDVEPAPAKVNLALHVTGRRADGYHLLDSLAVFPAIGDVVRASGVQASADRSLSLHITGPFGAALSTEPDNLVLRAARMLAEATNTQSGAQLTLVKNLPVTSGIGGGSADAAAALRLLQRLWNVAPGQAVLHAIATRLGADVPVCLAADPARMQGIGDQLSPVPPLPPGGIVLVNPGVAVSTPEVFRNRPPGFSPPLALPETWPDMACLAHDLARSRNDLQGPAIAVAPIIADVLDGLSHLPGTLLARMSGSGATCFALFATAVAATNAAEQIRRPGWWAWGGEITRPGLPDRLAGP